MELLNFGIIHDKFLIEHGANKTIEDLKGLSTFKIADLLCRYLFVIVINFDFAFWL